MEKTSIKTNTTTKDKAGFTSAELEAKFLKIAKHTTKDSGKESGKESGKGSGKESSEESTRGSRKKKQRNDTETFFYGYGSTEDSGSY